MVATNDSHYITREDAKMQSILLCIQTGKTVNDVDRMEFQTEEFYVKSTDEMYDLFSMVPEACENTNKIEKKYSSIIQENSATLTLCLAIPSSRISKLRTAWKIRNTLKSSVMRAWNAATPAR